MTNEIQHTLGIESKAKTPEQLFAILNNLGIGHETDHHPPMGTVSESKKFRKKTKMGAYTKNLFLHDKKGSMWLVTCREDTALDLHVVADQLQTGRLSFGSSERLLRFLGVHPGSVSPFALINDSTVSVSFAFATNLLEHKRIHLHPLNNAQTTTIAITDLFYFLSYTKHSLTYLEVAPNENR